MNGAEFAGYSFGVAKCLNGGGVGGSGIVLRFTVGPAGEVIGDFVRDVVLQ